jgi:hypothetical protein
MKKSSNKQRLVEVMKRLDPNFTGKILNEIRYGDLESGVKNDRFDKIQGPEDPEYNARFGKRDWSHIETDPHEIDYGPDEPKEKVTENNESSLEIQHILELINNAPKATTESNNLINTTGGDLSIMRKKMEAAKNRTPLDYMYYMSTNTNEGNVTLKIFYNKIPFFGAIKNDNEKENITRKELTFNGKEVKATPQEYLNIQKALDDNDLNAVYDRNLGHNVK